MLEIQKKQILKFASMLDTWGAEYKIILPDGEELGALEVAPKRKKAASKYPRGALSTHFLPYIEGMDFGDVVNVPAGEYPLETLRGSLSAWATHHWGNKSVTTFINHKTNMVEVLRIL